MMYDENDPWLAILAQIKARYTPSLMDRLFSAMAEKAAADMLIRELLYGQRNTGLISGPMFPVKDAAEPVPFLIEVKPKPERRIKAKVKGKHGRKPWESPYGKR